MSEETRVYDPEDLAAIGGALEYDPLAAAERKVGVHWQESKEAQALGLLGHLESEAVKKALMLAHRDTYYGML
jgi:hypothetical protein